MRGVILLMSCAIGCAALFAQGPPPGPGFGPRGGRGFGRAFGPAGGHAVVTGAPYSGTETTTTIQTLAGGNTITHKNTAQVYRDTNGDTAIVRTITPPASSGKAAFTETVINDVVHGYRYVLNSSTMTAIQSPLPKPRTSSSSTTRPTPTPPPGVTVVKTEPVTQTVNTVPASCTTTTETIAAGTLGNSAAIVVTRTVCIGTQLQVPVSIQSSDPRFGSSDFELTNISTSEPDSALFTVPSNYTIKTGPAFGVAGGRGRGAANWRGARQ